MLGLLDEAIAELRATAGVSRFDLCLVAWTSRAKPEREPMLPPPLPRELVESTLNAARLSDSSTERVTLMTSALAIVERNAELLPSDWRTDIRKSTTANIALEIQ